MISTVTDRTKIEEFLKENLQDFFVDGVSAIQRRTAWFTNGARFVDVEEDTEKTLGLEDFVRATELLVQEIANKKLFVGNITNPYDLQDAGNWDVEVVDALFQLAYHGKVIYG